MKKQINFPKNAEVIIKDNMITVVTDDVHEFKRGDVLFHRWKDGIWSASHILILDRLEEDKLRCFFSMCTEHECCHIIDSIVFNNYIYRNNEIELRIATEEEKQLLFNGLNKFIKGEFIKLIHIDDTTSTICFDYMDSYGNIVSLFGENGSGDFYPYINTHHAKMIKDIVHMTESEKKQLIDKLNKKGKDWDPEKKEIQ